MKTLPDVKTTVWVLSLLVLWAFVTQGDAAWEPPIGIPRPEFGVTETYRMYDDPANRNPALTYTQNAEGGYYTHYIDNTDPDATNADNPYGTSEKPRLTIPYKLAAGVLPPGSVVEVHGGPYTYYTQTAAGATAEYPEGLLGGKRLPFNGEGAAEQPIFIRGVGSPVFQPTRAAVWIEGSYVIVEGIVFQSPILLRPASDFSDHIHHVAIRNCDFSGARIEVGWPHGGGENHPEYRNPTLVDHIVVCNNSIHDIGDWDSSTTNLDSAGVVSHINAKYVWIVDNHIYQVESDALAVNCWGIYDDPLIQQPPMHIYIGRNNLHHCQENTLDVKVAYDVIVSQNVMHGIHKYVGGLALPGSDGTAVVGAHEDHGTDDFPYGKRYWYLFNEISDCDSGIRVQMSDYVYIIGNEIHDIHPSYALLDNGYSPGGCLQMWDNRHVSFVNNLVYDTALGVLQADYNPNAVLDISNNIIANLNADFYDQFGVQGWHVYVKQSEIADRSLLSNNLLYQNGDAVRIHWSNHSADLPVYPAKDTTGNFRTDPLWVDSASGNFNLQAGSPVIDNGISSDVYETFQDLYGIDLRKDIQGRARPQMSGWDIGAYEYIIEPVRDLAVSGESQNSVTIGWTVPGVEAVTGTPASYDIRYSDSEITEANWEAATQVSGEPVAGALGEVQTFTITGLSAGQTYYVAMKVLDEVGHFSELSNVVSETTPTSGNHAPVLNVGDRSATEMAELRFYSAPYLPAGAGFTPATRTFAWTPTFEQIGVHHATFEVTDGQVAVSETIAITVYSGSNHPPVLDAIGDKSVNDPPVLDAIDDKSVDEGQTLSFSVSATDIDSGDTLSYSASGLPIGADFSDQAFTWTPTYDQSGTYDVTFTVSDGVADDSETITITGHRFWRRLAARV